MVSISKIYPLLAFSPLVLTTIFFSISAQISPQDLSVGSNIQDQETNNISSNNKTRYLLTLQSGYTGKTIYERKADLGVLGGWGYDRVPINGDVVAVPVNKSAIADKIVLIQANQNSQLIYERYMKTDKNGKFDTSFFPPGSGNVQVTALLTGENSTTARGTITVIVTESVAPIIIIAILIGSAIAVIAGTWAMHGNKEELGPKDKRNIKLSLIPIGILILAAYIILYRFPPFDAAGNAAFATAMIAPIAAYVYQALTSSGLQTKKSESS